MYVCNSRGRNLSDSSPSLFSQTNIKQKDEQLTRLQEDVKDRFRLLVKVQDLEMDNADLKLMMEKFDKAQVKGDKC